LLLASHAAATQLQTPAQNNVLTCAGARPFDAARRHMGGSKTCLMAKLISNTFSGGNNSIDMAVGENT
jgi:hypothetical protein